MEKSLTRTILVLLMGIMMLLAVGCAAQRPAPAGSEPEVQVQPAEQPSAPSPAPAEPTPVAEETYEPAPLQPVTPTKSTVRSVTKPNADIPVDKMELMTGRERTAVPVGDLRKGRIEKITNLRRDSVRGKVKDLASTKIYVFESPDIILHKDALVTFMIDSEASAVNVKLFEADRGNEAKTSERKTGVLAPEPGYNILLVRVDGVTVRPGGLTHSVQFVYATNVTSIEGVFKSFDFITPVKYHEGELVYVKMNKDDQVVDSILKG